MTRYGTFFPVLLIAVLLSACQATPDTPRVLTTETDWGVIEISDENPAIIAVMLDLTTPGIEPVSRSQIEGIQAALDAVQTEEDIPVEIETIDTECNLSRGMSIAEALADREDVMAVIGTSCSEVCEVAAPIFEESDLLFVSATCGTTNLTDTVTGYETFIRTIYPNQVEGKLAADFAFEELGSRRAVIVQGTALDSAEISASFEATFEGRGGRVVGEANMQSEEGTSLSDPWSLVRETNADLVVLGADPVVALSLLNARTDAVADVPVIVYRNLRTEWLIERINDPAQIYGSGPEIDALYADFGFPLGYDAAALIFNALEPATFSNNAEPILSVDRYLLHATIEDTAAYPGLSGTLTCTSNGECSDRRTSISEITGGQWVSLYVSR